MKNLVFAIICLLPFFAIQAKDIIVDINDPAADFNSIQDAIEDDGTLDTDTIRVGPGTYKENINFMGKAVTVTGSNPDDPNVISLTIITAEDGNCVTFDSNETIGSILTGFTIDGNDICGGIYCDGTEPNIIKNIIKNCTTSGIAGENDAAPWIRVNTITSNAQTGIYNCHGLISDNEITHNNGGIAYCYETTRVINNVISDNNSPGWGGALSWCAGEIIGNIISNNHAAGNGGALSRCHGKVTDNIIVGNKADILGGGLYSCNGEISHNIIAANQSQNNGGGLSDCSGDIYNNTIVGNRAQVGAAMHYCTGLIRNNIIAFNQAINTGGGIYILGVSYNSYNTFGENDGGDFGGDAGAGEGDIFADPNFADECYWDTNGTPETDDDLWCDGDYHIKSKIGRWDPNIQMWVTDDVNSLCIDAGDPNSDWHLESWPYTGELWPHGGWINAGRYGGTAEASMSSSRVGNVADLNLDGLVDFQDMMLFAKKWPYHLPLLREDLDRDGRVDLEDYAILVANWHPLPPPSPNPMTWETEPNAISDSEITMVATDANSSDGSGVKYYFEETSGNPDGNDSGWLVSNIYVDDGLKPGIKYSYRVKARNILNKHETKFSAVRSATTFSPPTPNPMTWAAEPNATSGNSIAMKATDANSTDGSSVEYYFEDSNHPAFNSGWLDEPNYTDVNLAPFTTYCYRVKARNTGNLLETGFSDERCATTPTDDTTAPSPILWEIEPHEVHCEEQGPPGWDYCAEMKAGKAEDDSDDVRYFFKCSNDNYSRGDEEDWRTWQPEQDYKVWVGMDGQRLSFRFKACDKYGNISSEWSSWVVAE